MKPVHFTFYIGKEHDEWHLETLSYFILLASDTAGKISSYSTMQLGLSGTMNITKNAGVFGLYIDACM